MLKQPITSVQNSSGSVTSNAIRWVGLFPLKKKIYKTGSVCMYVCEHARPFNGWDATGCEEGKVHLLHDVRGVKF